jgi:hypothetical protein
MFPTLHRQIIDNEVFISIYQFIFINFFNLSLFSIMKKLTLTVAALLTATYLFAQNNEQTTTQNNSFNQATIDQLGTNHGSVVVQTSTATVIGDKNVATVKQRDKSALNANSSDISQWGKSNKSSVDQTGHNTAQVVIGGRVGQSWADAANAGNETVATQVGENNVGKQSIYGSTATATKLTLSQVGTGNTSEQLGAWSTNSTGKVTQGTYITLPFVGQVAVNGTSNNAWQQIDGNLETAEIYQTGKRNNAGQWINDGGSSSNDSYISQVGDDNAAKVISKGSGNVFSSTQAGDDNVVNGVTSGNMWSDAAEQKGNNNSAKLWQLGDGNTFTVRQYGNDNKIQGLLLSSAKQAGDNNEQTINQTGNSNMSKSLQLGDDNALTLAQTGNSNTSTTSQTGDDNIATLAQSGNGNINEATQTGNRNEYILAQTDGGQKSVLWQHKNALSAGNDNYASVTQSGAANLSTINQNGNSNNVVVTQGGGVIVP